MSIKKEIKVLLGNTLSILHLKNIFLNKSRNIPRIIVYHAVDKVVSDHVRYAGGITDFDTFKQQIKFFQNNFDIISLNEFIKLKDEEIRKERVIVLTFDDAIRDLGIPYLAERSIPFTVFIVSSLINNENIMWRHGFSIVKSLMADFDWKNFLKNYSKFKLHPPTQPDIMSWSMTLNNTQKKEVLNDLFEAIKFDIDNYLRETKPYYSHRELLEFQSMSLLPGAHTRTHCYVPRLNEEEYKDELIGSIEDISEWFSMAKVPFAFPFGPINNEYQHFLEEHPKAMCAFRGGGSSHWSKNSFLLGRAHGKAKNKGEETYNLILRDIVLKTFNK